MLTALLEMRDGNADFVDAYLAEVGRRHDELVAAVDRGFERLLLRRVEPGSTGVS